MSGARSDARALVAIAALSVACACGRPPAGGAHGTLLVVTQVPPGAANARPDRLSPDARYPGGSRVVLVTTSYPARIVRVLSRDLETAGAPSLSPGAGAVLFAGKRRGGSRWAIYETRLDGSRTREIVSMARDCVDPAYLADGRIVFACGNASSPGDWALYTSCRSGCLPRRITFGAGPAIDPAPLPDGRVLFSLGRATAEVPSEGLSLGLFTVNPDGTLLTPFRGIHGPPVSALRARPVGGDAVVYLAAADPGAPILLQQVKMSRPEAARTVALRAPDGTPVEIASAEPMPSGELLVSARTPGSSWGVYRAQADGVLQPVFDDPELDEVEALPSAPAPPPRGRPSPIDPTRNSGTLVCYDAARSDGIVGPPRGAPFPVTLELERLDGGRPHTLGELRRIAADGSFVIEAPADAPLRVRTRDAAGREIASSSWFWLRPGEVRACFGCHEGHDAAPRNRPVQALLEHPDSPETIR